MGIVPQLCVPTTGKFLTKAIVELILVLQALNLLKMALVSGKALTNVFNLVADQSVSE